MTLRDNQTSTKLLRATIIAAIIIRPRHCLAILIAALFLPRLPRYSPSVIFSAGLIICNIVEASFPVL
ncbi:hypothetical protein [Bradyrhizobium sp. STM 3561]|uniref:hypothetical protein n=1 Tax=Bradyrhizobium sp. STM 3561 TaxID=578923 RepID=UPI0038902CC6